VTAGEEWIYDGEEPIARFEHTVVEQPEQNLRYFDRNLNPIVLRDLKLTPGGRPLVAGVQLFWNLDGHIITTDLLDVAVEGRGSDTLSVTVISADPGGVALSRRVLTLTWDDDLESYVYDFACHLTLQSPETVDRPGSQVFGFEYSDPWYSDVPAPTVEFDGGWSAHGFTHLLAEPAAGDPCAPGHAAWQMPLNHQATGIPCPRSFREGGLFVLAGDRGNCPAFEFVGDTAARTSVGVCNWGYDIHLRGNYQRDQLYAPICERFRVRRCTDDKVGELFAAAAPIPAVDYRGFRELPRYERTSSFEKPLKLDQPAGALDPWPWLPDGDGTEWCRDFGRSDDASLKISRSALGVSEWSMEREGEGAWTQRWRQDTGFRVSVWVRTEAVQGRGASLGLRWVIYNHPERYPLVRSERIGGSSGWTQLSAEIRGPAPPEASAVCLVLRLDGSGTAWFDDLEVTLLSGSHAAQGLRHSAQG
jgi:hypothetical protein